MKKVFLAFWYFAAFNEKFFAKKIEILMQLSTAKKAFERALDFGHLKSILLNPTAKTQIRAIYSVRLNPLSQCIIHQKKEHKKLHKMMYLNV